MLDLKTIATFFHCVASCHVQKAPVVEKYMLRLLLSTKSAKFLSPVVESYMLRWILLNTKTTKFLLPVVKRDPVGRADRFVLQRTGPRASPDVTLSQTCHPKERRALAGTFDEVAFVPVRFVVRPTYGLVLEATPNKVRRKQFAEKLARVNSVASALNRPACVRSANANEWHYYKYEFHL